MTTIFTADQLAELRTAYATLQTANVDCLARFHRLFDGCTDAGLIQLATARIKFISPLAVNACTRRGIDVFTRKAVR